MVDDTKKKEQERYRATMEHYRKALADDLAFKKSQGIKANAESKEKEYEAVMGFRENARGEKSGHLQNLLKGSMSGFDTWENTMMKMFQAANDFGKLLRARMAKKFDVYDPDRLKKIFKKELNAHRIDPQFSLEMKKDEQGNLRLQMHSGQCDMTENQQFNEDIKAAFDDWAKKGNHEYEIDGGIVVKKSDRTPLSEEDQQEALSKIEDPETGFAKYFADQIAEATGQRYEVGKFEPKEEVTKDKDKENKEEPEDKPSPN